MKRRILLVALVCLMVFNATSLLAQPKVKKAVFQAFWWDYWNNNFPNSWANYLTELAPRLKAAGFDAIWIPPSYKNSSTGDVGYGPFDMYDLGDKYQKGGGTVKTTTRVGTKDELLRMIAVMHANGIEVIQDVVLNHNDGAGTNTGAGGQDPEASYSMRSSAGYKNFRFTSYSTPFINDSSADYWSRAGRWSKNYENFHPNAADNCTTGDICDAIFGPDLSYMAGAIGQSSNIPTSGTVTLNGITRPYHNPVQPNDYMRNSGRNWITWFKKQTGSDGWRWDAIKHFPVDVQEDYIYNTKYSVPVWAQGGTDMFCVGEWIGTTSDLDAYVNNVKTGVAPNGVTNETHTGTFDFNLRGYGSTGGIYSMVMGQGNYNMQSIPGDQQNERYMTYPDGHRVYRTVPFINSHDTYRPRLDASGNYLNALGVDSGWNESNELGGNGKHIDPREPRLAAAYATICAVDGNPDFFFEDVFDLGTTGQRWTHLPSDTAQLPWRSDLVNILQAHQKLSFKDGDYKVPTSLTGTDAPFYQQGNSGDHLVIERAGKALIGITDYYDTTSSNIHDEEVYVTADASMIGKVLYDYSGAHGITTSTVFSDGRVLIKTAPVSHHIPNAHGHGYSIWAPAPPGVTVTSVNDLYNYIASYTPGRSDTTTQEWEMANDLGDSHCYSLGQGGRLPDSSTSQRVAGKIYAAANKAISIKVYPETGGKSITMMLWDLAGNKLLEVSQVATSAAPVTGTFTPTVDGWYTIKVRNTYDTSTGQRCWVNVTYVAPTVVDTRAFVNLPAIKTAIWTGNKGTPDVFDCGNWEEGKVPSHFVDAYIPAYSKPFPIVKSNFSVKSLTVETGATITVDSATLSIGGNIISNLGAVAINGSIEMDGSTAQTIPANAFFDNTIKGLTINNGAGVMLAGTVAVTDVLTPLAGTLNANGYLILKSDSLHTARVEKGSAAGGYITGDATVERYIPARRAWRLLTAPVTGTQSVNAAWQEGATSTISNPAPSFGTHITGGSTANGFDQDPANTSSMQLWDETMAMFMPITSTLTTSIGSEQGYLVLVRGDRSVDLTVPNAPATNTVLRSKGGLKTGDQPAIPVPANQFTLVGSPYASPIDFTRITRTNVPDRFYVYDPQRSTTGAFVLLEGPDYTPMNAYGRYVDSNTLIQSGQAFMVEGDMTSTGSLTITENSKAATDRLVFRTGSINDEKLKINLHVVNANSTTTLADGAMARFDASYLNDVTSEDAGKPDNMDENLGIIRHNKVMMVERRQPVAITDTIQMLMYNMQDKNYRFEVVPTNLMTPDSAFLEDTYLNTRTPLSLTATTYYDFAVVQSNGSADPFRFRIVLKNYVLPVRFTTVKAAKQDRGIMVDWNVATENNVAHYEVEKSANGEQFTKSATVAVRNNNSAAAYSWLDVHPFSGNNFYRIKAVDNDGSVRYSNIVKVKIGGNGEIMVYPNPVKHNTLTVQLNNKPAGDYVAQLFNHAGQQVFTKTIQHSGGSAAQALQLKKGLAKGVYQLQVSNGSDRKTIEVVIEN